MEPARWLPFLSNASKILSQSLDYEETLAHIAELMVPALTDCCDVYMLLDERDEVFTRVTVKHRDSELMAELMRDGPRFRTVSRQLGHLSQTGAGKPILVDPITDEILQRSARSPEDLVVLRKLRLRSTLIVPLVARQTLLGTLILSMSDSGRRFGDEECAVAEELATRAALAVDNARLYRARVEGERQLRSIIDNSPAVIYLADGGGRILTANREYARRVGRSPSELVGRTIHDLMPDEEGAARIAAMEQRVVGEARAIQYEATHAERSGPRDWFVLKFPVTDEAGRVVGIGSISTDVTERKRAELALEHSQERFGKIFRASPLAISVTAVADGRFVEVNPACERLTGCTRGEMLGRTGLELGLWVRPDERVRAFEALHAAGSLSGFETQLRDRKGALHDVLLSLEQIEFGGERCTLALAQDITERKRLRERLEHAQRMEALGRLAGGVAHDFNNMLTAIQGYTGLLLDATQADASARGYAAHVQRAAERAAAMTRQLLVFGRQQVRETNVVDVNAAVNGILGMLRRLIGEDVRIEIVPSPDAACITIDPGQLEQVIVNLALNARDAMPSGGRLRIETGRSRLDGDAAVRLRVEDDGVGMDEATRARIFEPFFTTKEIGQGTGLGLATVYGIVEQAGGRILVTSEVGRGAQFDVLFPEATPSRAALVESGTAEAPLLPAVRGDTLLVVEDDDSVNEFVCLVLRHANYNILSARDGDAALHVAEQHDWRIDLLVTDIVMPNRNGRSLANELRGRVPALRVMYMSGYPGDTIERYDQIPVGDVFLQKPFSREGLLRMVARALARP